MSVKKDLIKQKKITRKHIQRLESGKATNDEISSSSDDELKEAIIRCFPADPLICEYFARQDKDDSI